MCRTVSDQSSFYRDFLGTNQLFLQGINVQNKSLVLLSEQNEKGSFFPS